ncbi:MAG: hypothetical protein IPN01_26925 [Deltaproteobacteria bacterium]|nr:hypothetical protein [Deltaproteobacteria bacterium]
MNKPRYKRPAAIDLGDLHVSIVRGPNAEGRWYWRARDADRATLWTGWATRDEAAREGAAILARPKASATAELQTETASTMGRCSARGGASLRGTLCSVHRPNVAISLVSSGSIVSSATFPFLG